MGGDEFLIFLHSSKEEIEGLSSLCQSKAANWDLIAGEKMSFAIGYATASEGDKMSLDELISSADSKMYQEKKRYYEERGLKIRD